MFESFAASEDALYELNARYDYKQEAFGSFCPKHRVHYGADCGHCEEEAAHLDNLQNLVDLAVTGEAAVKGSLSAKGVSVADRRDLMKIIASRGVYKGGRGYKVKAVGSVISWEAR